jgi:hypothetical protein
MDLRPYISVNEAAARLGTTPGEVRRLAEAAQLGYVVLIAADSVANYTEQPR